MVTRRVMMVVLLAGGAVGGGARPCSAQCCMSGLFAGCQSCFRKAPPAYAVAPAYAPIPAPVPAPPPPVMVPVQQVSYVPETTYQTKYQCVPVTTYKPSCEIDPCTGCSVECMQPVTSYQQQPVSVPVTQYRAVYSTKYVQMQPGYAAPTAYPTTYPAAPPAASPFAAPVQTSPQAWGAAGADVPQQFVPGQSSFAAPALPPQTPPQSTFQQVVPQSGTFPVPASQQSQFQVQPQPTAPPTLAPTPSLRPIPELPRTAPHNGSNGGANSVNGNRNGTGSYESSGVNGAGATGNGQPPAPGAPQPQSSAAPSLSPIWPSAAPAQGGVNGGNQMPVLPGTGPGPATGAFPKLLEPTGHTTQAQPMVRPASAWHPSQATAMPWQPMVPSPEQAAYASGRTSGGYPTAALPIRSQQ